MNLAMNSYKLKKEFIFFSIQFISLKSFYGTLGATIFTNIYNIHGTREL